MEHWCCTGRLQGYEMLHPKGWHGLNQSQTFLVPPFFPGQFWSSHIRTEREGCPSPAVSVALIGYPGDATVNIVHCEWCDLLNLPPFYLGEPGPGLSGLSGSLAGLVAQDCRQTDVMAGTVGDASITPTAFLHFVTPEVHSFLMECCVCLAALCCSALDLVPMLYLSNVCIKPYAWTAWQKRNRWKFDKSNICTTSAT